MSTPRCGVPDVHNHGMLHSISNYTFFGGSPRWSKYDLAYNFLPDSLQVVSFQVLRPVVARAIGFYRGDHGDGIPLDGPQNILAHAFSPPDGRFHYDADESWSSNPTRSQVDLESVTVHELGHNLGLDHSQYQSAIMYPLIPLGPIKRNLGQVDIIGLQALYGY
ncbi:hypothetical protein V6N11_020363 [Hibiscus sabdariffa]|uniref:Peptidase metallopeptidase domain-containing protein n=1 Tax=Hibiscus sabdariffa TaxID=183260 RepID=A0ABR2Q882_9ROSI